MILVTEWSGEDIFCAEDGWELVPWLRTPVFDAVEEKRSIFASLKLSFSFLFSFFVFAVLFYFCPHYIHIKYIIIGC